MPARASRSQNDNEDDDDSVASSPVVVGGGTSNSAADAGVQQRVLDQLAAITARLDALDEPRRSPERAQPRRPPIVVGSCVSQPRLTMICMVTKAHEVKCGGRCRAHLFAI